MGTFRGLQAGGGVESAFCLPELLQRLFVLPLPFVGDGNFALQNAACQTASIRFSRAQVLQGGAVVVAGIPVLSGEEQNIAHPGVRLDVLPQGGGGLVEERNRLREVLLCQCVSVVAQGTLSCQEEVVQGAFRTVAPRVVSRQEFDVRWYLVGVQFFDGLPDLAVQDGSLPAQDGAVDSVGDQFVAEGVFRGGAAGHGEDELPLGEKGNGLLKGAVLRGEEHFLQKGQVELPPDGGGHLKSLPSRGGELVETGQYQPLKGVRYSQLGQVSLDRAGGLDGVPHPLQNAAVEEHADHLFQVEGDAGGALQNLFPDFGGQFREIEQSAQQSFALGGVQLLQFDEDEVFPQDAPGLVERGLQGGGVLRTGDAQDEDGGFA